MISQRDGTSKESKLPYFATPMDGKKREAQFHQQRPYGHSQYFGLTPDKERLRPHPKKRNSDPKFPDEQLQDRQLFNSAISYMYYFLPLS
jgi:hypothetical protein